MFAGYFRFEHEGYTRIGYFNLFDGHQFCSVWLFSSVQKVTDRNDPAYVVEKPQLRCFPEIMLECSRTFAVWPVFVVHKSCFEDEWMVFVPRAVCVRACACARAHVCVCVYVCVCMWVCVCLCIARNRLESCKYRRR